MSEKKSLNKYEIVQPILLALMVVLGILLGRKIEQSSTPETTQIARPRETNKNNGALLEEAIRFIDARYIDSLDLSKVSDMTLQSLTKQLDPYSSYIPAKGLLDDSIHSFYDAYGFDIIQKNKKYLVDRIDPKSKAWNSNLEIGDEVFTINQTTPSNAEFNRWLNKNLNLDVLKGESKNHQTIKLFRQDSTQKMTVSPVLPLENHIGYLRINHFGDNTYDEFITAIDTLVNKHKIHHLIIDLRDNTGGYMEECARILNQLFQDKNVLMVATQGRTVRKSEYKTDGRQLFELDKIAVIINGRSASASEVFAGSIQDLDRGKVIGQPSFGKGLVQEQYMLSNGGALRLSVAKYFLPSGRTIGTIPDTTHHFKSLHGRSIKNTPVIIPDLYIKTDTMSLFTNIQELRTSIRSEIVSFKSKSQSLHAIEMEKKIITALNLRWNLLTSDQRASIHHEITMEWYKVTKDYTNWLKTDLRSQPEIMAAIKSL